MEAAQLLEQLLGRNLDIVKLALEKLSDEDLRKQPNDHSNPIGWTFWHQTRTEDRLIAALGGGPQVWENSEWPEKFEFGPDPANSGRGHGLDQVKAFRASKEALLGYAAAVREKTLAFLRQTEPKDLDRIVELPGRDPQAAGDYLTILASDYLHHSGQICYLRGYFKEWGWFPM